MMMKERKRYALILKNEMITVNLLERCLSCTILKINNDIEMRSEEIIFHIGVPS